ncbi:MAG: LTA synthase family protein [Daejeonella sp.]
MSGNNKGKYLRDSFLNALKSFTALLLIWLALIMVFRLLEFSFAGFTHGLSSQDFKLLGSGIASDLILWINWQFGLFIIYALIYFLSANAAKNTFRIFIVIFFIVHTALVLYFNTSLVLLGADFYGYSINDMKQTVGSSGTGLYSILVFLLMIGSIMAVIHFFEKKINTGVYFSAGMIFIAAVFTISGYQRLFKPSFSSDFENNMVLNKSGYFYNASYNHFFPEIPETDIYADDYIQDYTTAEKNAIQFEYVDEDNFPFLHEEAAQDVLSPFFNPQETAPNIVIIILEGLGRAYSNEDAYLGSFTPFLDSLAEKGLFWKNFLSQGGRTFAVLPSILGSLPFAKNGFLELGKQMPRQLSLIDLLKFNGYHSAFYSGTDATFDNMDLYVRNRVDEYRDLKTFPGNYTKLPAVNGFTWGYNDKELFRYYFASRPDIANKPPQFSILLTVSSHNPFIINEPGKYLKLFEDRMNFLKLGEAEKSDYRNYKNQYASVLYADDALRNFINDYSKRSDFNNTIFIITGDHRMPEIPMITKIDRYHVPFVIYSPLLKRTAAIASLSSHNDVTPSILAYLKNNHPIKIPSVSSWLGHGLDTARNFRNIQGIAMMQNKTDLLDFVLGEYHLNGETLYKLSPTLNEEPANDPEKKAGISSAFSQFKKRNAMISTGKKIIPDSLYQNYVTPK